MGFILGVLAFIRAVVGYLAGYSMMCFVLYWPGWVVIKIATFGKYPRTSAAGGSMADVEVVAMVGFLVVSGGLLLINFAL